jgi:hypothetical protein
LILYSEINTKSKVEGNEYSTNQDASVIERTLFEMITDNQLKAKIDVSQQMISFIDITATSGASASTNTAS